MSLLQSHCLTEHADNEAIADGFNIYDAECGILRGKTQKKTGSKKANTKWWAQRWMDDFGNLKLRGKKLTSQQPKSL